MNKILASQERPFEDIIVEIKGGGVNGFKEAYGSD
jgi:ribosomal protein S9